MHVSAFGLDLNMTYKVKFNLLDHSNQAHSKRNPAIDLVSRFYKK
jgi:hypothetical protein